VLGLCGALYNILRGNGAKYTSPKMLCVAFLALTALIRVIRGGMILGHVININAMDFMQYFAVFTLWSAYCVVVYTWGRVVHCTVTPSAQSWPKGLKVFVVWNIIAYIGFIVLISTLSKAPTVAYINGWIVLHVLLVAVGFLFFARYFYKQVGEALKQNSEVAAAVVKRATKTAIILSIGSLAGMIIIAVLSFITLAENGMIQGLVRNVIFRFYEWIMEMVMLWFLYPRVERSEWAKSRSATTTTSTTSSTASSTTITPKSISVADMTSADSSSSSST